MSNATLTLEQQRHRRSAVRGTDPSRPARSNDGLHFETRRHDRPARSDVARKAPSPDGSKTLTAAVDRQQGQLPAFAPLLEEVELNGWSAHQRMRGGNFHDWMLLDDGRVLVMVGQAVGAESGDPIEMALVAQAAWTSVRAHSCHTDDAGQLLSLAARTLGGRTTRWTNPAMSQQAVVAVALVDSVGGSASLAIAGDCLAWRVRAATWEQFACDEPPLGAETNFAYTSHDFAMSLRERLLLVADHPLHRPTRFAPSVAADFAELGAEAHRRMTAADALSLVRRRYEHEMADDTSASASIVAVRRR